MNEIQARLRKWWRGHVEAFFERPWKERSVVEKITGGLVALTYLTTREVLRDRGPMMAASLAYFTVLAMVPLVTVAASLVAAFGMLEGEGGAVFDTLYQLFPEVASGLASYLGEVAAESAQALGGIGGLTLLIIGLVLFNAIEETLTKIWRGAHDRGAVTKLLTFYAVITFGPVLIALSIVQTASAQIYLTEIGLDVSIPERALPLLYALVAFTLLNKIVPNAEVKWRSALVGGLFTAIVFELAKWGFNVYVNQLLMQTYDRVYGTLALIPIGLIWVYITWFVILIGAELAYSFQYLRELMQAEAGRRSSEALPGEYRAVHPMVALEVLAPIMQAYQKGDGAISEDALEETTELPPHILRDILDHWRDLGVILEVGNQGKVRRQFLPSGPPESFSIASLIDPFWVKPRRRSDLAVQGISEAYLDASKKFFEGQSGVMLLGNDVEDTRVAGRDGVPEGVDEPLPEVEKPDEEQEEVAD